MRTEHRIEV